MSTTKIIEADPEDPQIAINAAAELLAAGEIVALPTETVYGLAANALDENAVAKIFEAKDRPSYDPLIVHVAKPEDVHLVAEIPAEVEETINKLMAEFWPGALTFVLPKKDSVPDSVTAGLPTVAVRMSAHPVMRAICKKFGKPIAAPSANLFGRISPTSAQAVLKELGGRIPAIIDGGACLNGLESTIVKVQPGKKSKDEIVLLRSGPVTREMMLPFGKMVKPKVKRDAEGKADAKAQESPGMLDSHYSPVTPFKLLEKPEDFVAEEGKVYALLSHRGTSKAGYLHLHDWDTVEILSPGKGKLSEAAVRLFYCMRKLDEAGVDMIVAEPLSEVGIGVAIMDRLRRASEK
ncbi:L-threonylcarbamoyladenylate synthase [Persicirhabdus sediminis]|uniref:Threonylcarbamoyl-AMP synthase n=1 Tax=Persicirhabdus sediminis TaxID=454144 RepID=A0A8J7MCJ1_9BACT|nr:L-threonylcarbamoyladenylate synthase [Persicirhabdus sediminis]MBK1790647.1 threonylcarbamoyl-AMP synthase [Persicirhabdus sediminis]